MDWAGALQGAKNATGLAASIQNDLAWRDGADVNALGVMWSNLQLAFIQLRCAVRKRQYPVAARRLRDICNYSLLYERKAVGTTSSEAGQKLTATRTQLQSLLE